MTPFSASRQIKPCSTGSYLVEWFVDDIRIATVDLGTVSLGGSSIFFGHSDTNATSSIDPNDEALLFTLIDNIQVRAPEPEVIGMMGLSVMALIRRWRRAR
jgi:hypothetical protein